MKCLPPAILGGQTGMMLTTVSRLLGNEVPGTAGLPSSKQEGLLLNSAYPGTSRFHMVDSGGPISLCKGLIPKA